MVYCILKGGLGNMMFQIAATMEFSKKNNVGCSFPNLQSHLRYLEIETAYNSNLTCVKHYRKLFENLNTQQPPSKIKKINFPFHYVDLQITESCVIEGFFQSEKYFKNSRNEILNLFPKKDKINKISMHVSRGDYVTKKEYHNVLSKDYYLRCMDKFPNERFLIFSDDLQWCQRNFSGDRFSFYQGLNDLDDLTTMASCKHNIISNSSFSWWGAWINNHSNKIVLYPSRWVGPNLGHLNTTDIPCEEWTMVRC